MLEVEARGPVSDEDLARVEQQLGVSLPPAYRRRLQTTGGGPPEEPYGIDEVDGEVNTFVGLGPDYSILEQYQGFDVLLPRDLIRIAYGNGGTIAIKVKVKVKGEDVGSIWWSDHDKAQSIGASEPSYDYCTKIAEDFDAFLARF